MLLGEYVQVVGIGGMLIAKVAGYVLEWTGSCQPMFIIASSAYLVALLVMHLLVPNIEPVHAGLAASE